MQKTILTLLLVSGIPVAGAQINVETDGNRVTIGRDGAVSVGSRQGTASSTGTSSAGNAVGVIEGDVSTEGVTVINGKVWIDGEPVPPGVTRHRSRSGKVYRIERKNGTVAVTSE
jgi:hypothetical protein